MHMGWTGQDSGTSRDGGMSNGCPTPHGCPMDVPWMSIRQVDWIGQWDKPGQ